MAHGGQARQGDQDRRGAVTLIAPAPDLRHEASATALFDAALRTHAAGQGADLWLAAANGRWRLPWNGLPATAERAGLAVLQDWTADGRVFALVGPVRR